MGAAERETFPMTIRELFCNVSETLIEFLLSAAFSSLLRTTAAASGGPETLETCRYLFFNVAMRSFTTGFCIWDAMATATRAAIDRSALVPPTFAFPNAAFTRHFQRNLLTTPIPIGKGGMNEDVEILVGKTVGMIQQEVHIM